MKKERLAEIDLLRFLAAVAVLLYHYTVRSTAKGLDLGFYQDSWLSSVFCYGHLGVELFFMISGFVIFMSIDGKSLPQFIASRISRLYPAYWVCCTITFFVMLIAGGEQFSANWAQYLANMTMLNGFVKIPYIDGVYWTLFVELRFYGLVGLMLLLNMQRFSEKLLYLWLLFAAFVAFFEFHTLLRFAVIDKYAPYFISGSLCYLIWKNGFSYKRMIGVTLSWTVACYQIITPNHDSELSHSIIGIPEIAVGVITIFFLVMLLISTRKTGSVANINWIYLGALTYPLYLIHQNIGYIILLHFKYENIHVFLWLTVSFFLVLAYLINTYIEKRFGKKMNNFILILIEHLHEKLKRVKLI